MPHDWDNVKTDTCDCLGCRLERALKADKAKRDDQNARRIEENRAIAAREDPGNLLQAEGGSPFPAPTTQEDR